MPLLTQSKRTAACCRAVTAALSRLNPSRQASGCNNSALFMAVAPAESVESVSSVYRCESLCQLGLGPRSSLLRGSYPLPPSVSSSGSPLLLSNHPPKMLPRGHLRLNCCPVSGIVRPLARSLAGKPGARQPSSTSLAASVSTAALMRSAKVEHLRVSQRPPGRPLLLTTSAVLRNKHTRGRDPQQPPAPPSPPTTTAATTAAANSSPSQRIHNQQQQQQRISSSSSTTSNNNPPSSTSGPTLPFNSIPVAPDVIGYGQGRRTPASDALFGAALSSPREIVEHLDEYIIGQERAKKVLAVAVFNHYQRVRANLLQQQRQSQIQQRNLNTELYNTVQQIQLQREHEQQPQAAGSTSAPPGDPWAGEPVGRARSVLMSMNQPGRASSSINNNLNSIGSNTSNINNSNSNNNNNNGNADVFDEECIPEFSTSFDKSNVLMVGPSGSGKTLLARTLAKILRIPFSMSDATPLTQAGYVGEDVEQVVHRLLQASDYDVRRAEQGIIFIDEIDKIARKSDHTSATKDVSGEGVQQALLRILEGTVVTITDKSGAGHNHHHGSHGSHGHSSNGNASTTTAGSTSAASSVPPQSTTTAGSPNASNSSTLDPSVSTPSPRGRHASVSTPKGDVYQIDTTNILFIVSGAFVDLDKIIMERIAKGSIGFGNQLRSTSQEDSNSSSNTTIKQNDLATHVRQNLLDYVEPADLQRFGFIPEFIGRLPVVSSVAQLTEDELVRILTEPRNALVKQYTALFAMNGISLHFSNAALRAIAKRALQKNTGARGLRRIMESILLDAMYDTPGSSTHSVVVDAAAANMQRPPRYYGRNADEDVHQILEADDISSTEAIAAQPAGSNQAQPVARVASHI